MAQYLDKFKGIIGKRQTQQIIKLLNKKRNTGQIRTMEEFSEQLESLVRDLTSTVLKPSLSLWPAVQDEKIDSETWNFMLDRVQDDLEAAFEESLQIDEVQKSHEAIVRDVILKNLRAGVAELESKIDLYEFLNKDVRGFDSAIFSTFRESKEGRTQRGIAGSSIIFLDPRTKELISSVYDAEVELVGERLTLSNDVKTVHTIRNARQIFDSESPQSELIVEPPGVDIRNIIDNTKGTYWVQSLLFTEPKEFVKVKIELDLGIVKEINFIDIEPASRYGIILESIHYADGNNVITDIGAPEILVESPVSVRVEKTATNRIILTFRNENPNRIQFTYSSQADPLFAQALVEPPEGITPSIGQVSNDLDELLASTQVKDLLGVESLETQTFAGYDFLTGIDNVRVGLTSHASRSIYISSPLSICGAGELGLITLESRPWIDPSGNLAFTNDTYDVNPDPDASLAVGEQSEMFFQGSIEYWVIRQDLSSAGTLVRTSTFPVLPLDVQRIFHERLVLNEKSDPSLVNNDIGTFVFFTTRDTHGDIKVYRNGELLEDNTGVFGAVEGWIHLESQADRTPNNKNRMRFRIQILDQLPGDIFTVSYTPMTSSTQSIPKTLSEFTAQGGLKIVDLVGDLSARSELGQIVVLDRIGEDDVNLESKVFLLILLRQNTAESSLTPAVEEYTLVAGCKDPTKFEGI